MEISNVVQVFKEMGDHCHLCGRGSWMEGMARPFSGGNTSFLGQWGRLFLFQSRIVPVTFLAWGVLVVTFSSLCFLVTWAALDVFP